MNYVEIIHAHSRPMPLQPTHVEPRHQRLNDIRAVLFDLYGTLVISGSGEVGTAIEDARAEAMAEALAEVGIDLPSEVEAQDAEKCLLETIEKHHQKLRAEGIEYPEVDIVDIWRDTLDRLDCDGDLERPEDLDLRQLAVEYEVRKNPVWPMPGASRCLTDLKASGRRLGLISNAQFFTPELLPALFARSVREMGFSPELAFFSFEQGEAKPARTMFQRAAEALNGMGIRVDQTLYMGNDMRNDIWPASVLGFRTALFAGDQRSYRPREDDPDVRGIQPDLVLTDLAELSLCLD